MFLRLLVITLSPALGCLFSLALQGLLRLLCCLKILVFEILEVVFLDSVVVSKRAPRAVAFAWEGSLRGRLRWAERCTPMWGVWCAECRKLVARASDCCLYSANSDAPMRQLPECKCGPAARQRLLATPGMTRCKQLPSLDTTRGSEVCASS